jgi:hypothetical protein
MIKVKIGLETLTITGRTVRPKGPLATVISELLDITTKPSYEPDFELYFFRTELEPFGAELIKKTTDNPSPGAGLIF